MMNVEFIPVYIPTLVPPQQDIFPLLQKYCPLLQEKDLIFISSKVLAIHQGRCVKMDSKNLQEQKRKLVTHEADTMFWNQTYQYTLTIKDDTLIGSAGIDESNGNGYFILWPKDYHTLLKDIRHFFTLRDSLQDLGIMATDSHVTPLRQGVVGTIIGKHGVSSLKDYRGTPDIFGRIMQGTQLNVLESLVGTVCLYMGEGDEHIPLVIVRDISASSSHTSHASHTSSILESLRFDQSMGDDDLKISQQEDIYATFYENFKKVRKK